jgi:hypothetical protein
MVDNITVWLLKDDWCTSLTPPNVLPVPNEVILCSMYNLLSTCVFWILRWVREVVCVILRIHLLFQPIFSTRWPRYNIFNIYQIENKYNIEIKIESYINTSISNGSIIYNYYIDVHVTYRKYIVVCVFGIL